MPVAYRIAPTFVIRLAGAPFESLQHLGTPETMVAARGLLEKKAQLAGARVAVDQFFQSRERLLSEKAYRALRVAVSSGKPPAAVAEEQPEFFTNYAAAARAVSEAELEVRRILERELALARSHLLENCDRLLPPYFVFTAAEVRNLSSAPRPEQNDQLTTRNSWARKRERHLLLYLQRIATKNDTFSEFGPTAWGSLVKESAALTFRPRPGISNRETFLERWTAHTLAAAMNADPEVFPELVPRLNPNVRRVDQLLSRNRQTIRRFRGRL